MKKRQIIEINVDDAKASVRRSNLNGSENPSNYITAWQIEKNAERYESNGNEQAINCMEKQEESYKHFF